MLRLSARRLAAAGKGCRRISTSTPVWDEAEDKGPKAFLKEFGPKVSSTLAPPSFPSDYYKRPEKQEEGGALPEKLTFNLFLPHEQHSKQSKVRITAGQQTLVARRVLEYLDMRQLITGVAAL